MQVTRTVLGGTCSDVAYSLLARSARAPEAPLDQIP